MAKKSKIMAKRNFTLFSIFIALCLPVVENAPICDDVKEDGIKKDCIIKACTGDEFDENWCGKGTKIRILDGKLGDSKNNTSPAKCNPQDDDCTGSMDDNAPDHLNDVKDLCNQKERCKGLIAYKPTKIHCGNAMNDSDYEVIKYDCDEGPPDEISNLQCNGFSDSVHLQWKSGKHAGGMKLEYHEISYSIENMKVKNYTNISYTGCNQPNKPCFYEIKNLKEETLYSIRVRAVSTNPIHSLSDFTTCTAATSVGSAPVLSIVLLSVFGTIFILTIIIIVLLIVCCQKVRAKFGQCIYIECSWCKNSGKHTDESQDILLKVEGGKVLNETGDSHPPTSTSNQRGKENRPGQLEDTRCVTEALIPKISAPTESNEGNTQGATNQSGQKEDTTIHTKFNEPQKNPHGNNTTKNRNASSSSVASHPVLEVLNKIELDENIKDCIGDIQDMNHVNLKNKIATGTFGPVYLCKSPHDPNEEIVVKTISDRRHANEDQLKEFVENTVYFLKIKPPDDNNINININWPKSIGLHEEKLCLIFPYMEKGNLHKLVMNEQLKSRQLAQICLDIAEGMEYLSENKIVHGKLTAKRIFVNTGYKAKVSISGITKIGDRDHGPGEKRKKPHKWLAPEGHLTEEADVWSFGVVTWEIFSGGAEPFRKIDPDEYKEHVKKKDNYLKKPEVCPIAIYHLYRRCTSVEHERRPKFEKIVNDLKDILEQYKGEPTHPDEKLWEALDRKLRKRLSTCLIDMDDLNHIEKCPEDGRLGDVWIYEWKGEKVAVKMSEEESYREEFLSAAVSSCELRKKLEKDQIEQHILCSHGVGIRGSTLYNILPYMSKGNLLAYMKDKRNHWDYGVKNTMKICLQVAKGMETLSEHHIIHRNLCTKNILLDSKGDAFVSDFRIPMETTRPEKNRSMPRNCRRPFKWMPPESFGGKFVDKSDVWSFGVILWQLLSGGEQPYAGVEDFYMFDFNKDEDKLKCPESESDDIKLIFGKCQKIDPKKRSSFGEIVKSLERAIKDRAKGHSEHQGPSSPRIDMSKDGGTGGSYSLLNTQDYRGCDQGEPSNSNNPEAQAEKQSCASEPQSPISPSSTMTPQAGGGSGPSEDEDGDIDRFMSKYDDREVTKKIVDVAPEWMEKISIEPLFLTKAVQCKLITSGQKKIIQNKNTPHDKNDALLDYVQNDPKEKTTLLLKTLRATQQDRIVDKFISSANKHGEPTNPKNTNPQPSEEADKQPTLEIGEDNRPIENVMKPLEDVMKPLEDKQVMEMIHNTSPEYM